MTESDEIKVNMNFLTMRLGSKALDLFKALAPSRTRGFDDYCIITQSWHESGRYERVIGDWNFWGIKKPRAWVGKMHSIKTHEFVNGARVEVIDDFIDFENCDLAVEWWCGLIERLYPQAYAVRAEPLRFFPSLISGRYQYATDPRYADKLTELYCQISQYPALKNILALV